MRRRQPARRAFGRCRLVSAFFVHFYAPHFKRISLLTLPAKRCEMSFDFNNPVCSLTGNEFLPKEGITFADQVLQYYQSLGGKADSQWGEVLLDKKGIQSDKSHGIGRIKAASFAAVKEVLENGTVILPLDYYEIGGKKQMTGMMAAPIVIGTDYFICVVVVIFNLIERRLYLHETFLTEKIPEIAASSLVRVGKAESPQSRGKCCKDTDEFSKKQESPVRIVGNRDEGMPAIRDGV